MSASCTPGAAPRGRAEAMLSERYGAGTRTLIVDRATGSSYDASGRGYPVTCRARTVERLPVGLAKGILDVPVVPAVDSIGPVLGGRSGRR